MRILGYRHQSLSRHHFHLWLAGKTDQIIQEMQSADSYDDWPWPLIYHQVSLAFPDSRFILTTRKDERTWYDSLCAHVERQKGKGFPYRKFIYGYEHPNLNPDHHLHVYRTHNARVRRFFADQPHRLLEVCWEAGDEWSRLCHFIGHPVPEAPFPHCNRAPPPPLG
ncbi:MAG: sulfotransferase [Cyanobium sp.]